MNNNFLFYLLNLIYGFILLFLQLSPLNPLPFFNLFINYLAVFSICISISSRISHYLFVSFCCGLLIDLWFSSCSFYTISLLVVNSLVYFFSVKSKANYVVMLISVIGGTFVMELINASLLGFCYYSTPFNPFEVFRENILNLLIGNTLFGLILFSVIRKNQPERPLKIN